MEIASRESQLLTTIKYFTGCKKTIWIWKFYNGDAKTPVNRLKTVEFRNPYGIIVTDRTYSNKLLIDKSKESEIYRKRCVKMVTHIHYVDGCTKTIDILKHYAYDGKKPLTCFKTPYSRHKTVEFKNRDYTIDKNRSRHYIWIYDKSGESDFEDESPDAK